MKKFLLILSLCVSISSLFAQVPDKVKMRFNEKYPNMSGATWTEMGDNEYAVTFTDRNNETLLVYDQNGELVSTDMVTNTYPDEIKTYYVKNYPDMKTYHVWVATDAKGNKTYYVRDHGYRIWFDKTGNFVRKEGDKVKQEYKEEKEDMKNDDH